jgi:hypothetical protein
VVRASACPSHSCTWRIETARGWLHTQEADFREQGAIMVVDSAQAAPRRRIDVQKLGCDFLAFSSHIGEQVDETSGCATTLVPKVCRKSGA